MQRKVVNSEEVLKIQVNQKEEPLILEKGSFETACRRKRIWTYIVE